MSVESSDGIVEFELNFILIPWKVTSRDLKDGIVVIWVFEIIQTSIFNCYKPRFNH